MILKENMENMNPESLLQKAHALGEDIKEKDRETELFYFIFWI